MSPKSVRRTAAALAMAPALMAPVLIATAAPAAAADSYFSRTTGFAATTSWVQELDFPGDLYGNVHVGQLYAFETSPGRADVFSFIDDFTCPTGVFPVTDPHGGTQPNGCTPAGSRFLDGTDISLTVGRRGVTATLSGGLTASTAGDPHTGEGGSTIGTVPANFTWTAVGDPVRSSSTQPLPPGRRDVHRQLPHDDPLEHDERAARPDAVRGGLPGDGEPGEFPQHLAGPDPLAAHPANRAHRQSVPAGWRGRLTRTHEWADLEAGWGDAAG